MSVLELFHLAIAERLASGTQQTIPLTILMKWSDFVITQHQSDDPARLFAVESRAFSNTGRSSSLNKL